MNGEEYGSAEQYYNDTTQLAASQPEMSDQQAEELEWMPLGVFALTAEGVNASSMYLQLAVSKNGMIAGTFYNESTGVTHPVEGMVDEETQRAVWMAADGTNTNIVMETGIYNLAEDQAEVLVHFGPEETQNVLLVRLDESERPADEAATAREAAPAPDRQVSLNLPGVQLQVGSGGVQVRAPGVNVDTSGGATSVTAPAGVKVDTGQGGTQVKAAGTQVTSPETNR